jgi:hypothetical protein
MASTAEARRVSIGFCEPVEICPGLTIPAEIYPGRMERTTRLSYWIELTAEQMQAYWATMGCEGSAGKFEVTKFFNLGLAYVAKPPV